MTNSTVAELVLVDLWQQATPGGTLTVIPDYGPTGLSIPIRRVFTITGVPAGGLRGDHAHRYCTQVVVCLHGRITITVDDSDQHVTMVLDSASKGLLIPPGLWNRLVFDGPDTVIAVFCDQPYDTSDYLRDRNAYEALKRPGNGTR